jgi:hypothetical protein
MEHSDKGFEEFRDLLRPFRESHPLLWRIRDNLYAALYYRVPGGGRERRHRAGLWSWSLWAVERHITLDRTMYGSDQAASLEERGMEIMIKGILSYEIAHGTGQKTCSQAEKGVAKKLRYWE